MLVKKKGKFLIGILIFLSAFCAGKLYNHFEGDTFTERIITEEDEVYEFVPSNNHIIDGKININAASAQELAALNGIGEKLSQRIVAYREEHGAFSQTEGIMLVQGIGEKMYEKIKDQITID